MLTSVQVNERCYTVFKSQSLKSCDDQVNGLQKNNTEQLGKLWGEGEEWGRGLEFKPTPHSLVFSDRALFTIWWNHQSLMAAVSHQLQADISSVWFSVGLRNTGCGSETESEEKTFVIVNDQRHCWVKNIPWLYRKAPFTFTYEALSIMDLCSTSVVLV